jgi:hypothetical protein
MVCCGDGIVVDPLTRELTAIIAKHELKRSQ